MDNANNSIYRGVVSFVTGILLGTVWAIYWERKTPRRINNSVHKNIPKIITTYDKVDIEKNAKFCRCWRSRKFPFCDGSHDRYNAASGDNVGPVIISGPFKMNTSTTSLAKSKESKSSFSPPDKKSSKTSKLNAKKDKSKTSVGDKTDKTKKSSSSTDMTKKSDKNK